jgi:hypothetical protein
MGDIVVEVPGLALGPANPIIMGEPTVMIGEVGMGTPVVVPPVPPMVLLAQAMSGSGTTGPSSSSGSPDASTAAQSLAQAAQTGIPFIQPCAGCEALAPAVEKEEKPEVVDPKKTSWVEIELIDDEGLPVAFEAYRVQLPDDSIIDGTLDGRGQARIEGIDPGTCKVTFPDRDAKDWKRA